MTQIKYLQSRLALSFRNRLTKHVHGLYLDAKTYYKVLNLDSRIENADQYGVTRAYTTRPGTRALLTRKARTSMDGRGRRLITSDVSKFCDALAELYGNIGKPALDMYLFSTQLEQNLGDRGMGGLWWAYYFTAAVMRAITPNFGKLRETEAKLEVRRARERRSTAAAPGADAMRLRGRPAMRGRSARASSALRIRASSPTRRRLHSTAATTLSGPS